MKVAESDRFRHKLLSVINIYEALSPFSMQEKPLAE